MAKAQHSNLKPSLGNPDLPFDRTYLREGSVMTHYTRILERLMRLRQVGLLAILD
jgi:hypothetical protein